MKDDSKLDYLRTEPREPKQIGPDYAKRRAIDAAIAQVAKPEPPKEEPKPEPPKKVHTNARLSPDEIVDQIHRLAREGEGADQRWALNQLKAQDTGLAVEKPKSQDEIDRRLGRLMKSVGVQSVQRAYRLTFPQSTPPGWTAARAVGHVGNYLPTTINQLFEFYPESPKDKDGAPPGYPHDATLPAKRKWIANYAHQLDQARKEEEGTPTDGQPLDPRP